MPLYGYHNRFLEINLSTESIREISFPEDVLQTYIGGRALAAKVLFDRLGDHWEEVDPLGPENILTVFTGPLTGFFPGARTCVSGKSPLTLGIVGSTFGGEFASELRAAGWDGIIITGRASSPVYIYIFNDNVEIRDASHLWGKTTEETHKILVKEIREELQGKIPYIKWRDPGMLYIGPAGENKVRTAAVSSKWTHAGGYGGYGSVFGSKNLKAIVVKGTGPLPDAYDISKVKELSEVVASNAVNHVFKWWGTAYLGYQCGYTTSSEPIRNWQEEWHDNPAVGVDKYDRRMWVKRYWGDFGCPLTCYKLAFQRTGPWEGTLSDNTDYELQAYLGTNLGIFVPEDNNYLSYLADSYGLCGIQTGNVLGFAAELYQRGILSKEDLDGIDLKWGNTEAFAKMMLKIAKREGIGDKLAEGTWRFALYVTEWKGVDVTKYAVVVKGHGIGAHGNRSGLDYPQDIAYACSVQGGDHTSVAALPPEAGELGGPLLFDSGVFCWFNAFTVSRDVIFKFFQAVTGWDWFTPDKWDKDLGLRALAIQRAALLLGGPDIQWLPTSKYDDNPPRFYEPLPTGPCKGKAVDRDEFLKHRAAYYEAVGWDEKGVPKSELLKQWGLDNVNAALNRIRGKA